MTPAKKGICPSRSFGKLITDKEEIKEAVANHAAACAFKLRKQDSCAGLLEAFLLTNEHRKQDQQVAKKIIMHLPRATNHSNLIIHYAMKAVDMLYKRGYNFYKGGVEVKEIVPSNQVQGALWDEHGKPVSKALMKAMDGLIATWEHIPFGLQGKAIARFGRSEMIIYRSATPQGLSTFCGWEINLLHTQLSVWVSFSFIILPIREFFFLPNKLPARRPTGSLLLQDGGKKQRPLTVWRRS